ncbi:hypothetical protein [Microbacterium sp. PA5]|uniref:hypothetical protein n=1 Tax=Microbacterium sp. PA5 TaxID=3416654 RepID=UPI003CFB45B9
MVMVSRNSKRSGRIRLAVVGFFAAALVGLSPTVADAYTFTFFNGYVAPGVYKYGAVPPSGSIGGELYGLFGQGGTGRIEGYKPSTNTIMFSTSAPHDSWVYLNYVRTANVQSRCKWIKKYATTPDDAKYLQCRAKR